MGMGRHVGRRKKDYTSPGSQLSNNSMSDKDEKPKYSRGIPSPYVSPDP
jgi:hypothetical protein